MAKGKNKSKSKKSGIQRFLDALLCCCGKRRSGKRHYSPSTESKNLAESEQIIENTTTNQKDSKIVSSGSTETSDNQALGEAIECEPGVDAAATNKAVDEATDCEPAGDEPTINKPTAAATDCEMAGHTTGSEPIEETWYETREAPPGMDEYVGQSSTETNTPDDLDGFIDVRGLAVSKKIRDYRKEILVDVDTLIEEFKYQGTKYLLLVHGADLDDITVTTDRRATETAVEVTSNGRTYMLHVMDDGGVQVMEAVWDSVSDLWYNKTYLMTYWGLELISQAAV